MGNSINSKSLENKASRKRSETPNRILDYLRCKHPLPSEANIIHRDIKQENLKIELNRHPNATNFGIAGIWSQDNSKETSDFLG